MSRTFVGWVVTLPKYVNPTTKHVLIPTYYYTGAGGLDNWPYYTGAGGLDNWPYTSNRSCAKVFRTREAAETEFSKRIASGHCRRDQARVCKLFRVRRSRAVLPTQQ